MKYLHSSNTGLSWGMVDTPRAAALLVDPEAFRYLTPFLGATCSASQAALLIHARIDTVMYRIERLLEAGLLEKVPGPTPRSRKRYRAVADRFVVPFEVTKFETLVELFVQRDAPQQRQFAEALVRTMAGDGGGWMLRIHRDDRSRGVTVDAAPDDQLDWEMTEMLRPEAPATWFTFQGLSLDPVSAKELQQDLLALWMKYDVRNSSNFDAKNRVKHFLQLQLAPVKMIVSP